MATHLIGLLGRKRSGKDTFAERLVSHHGYTRFAFADALRAAAEALDPYVGWTDLGFRVRLSDALREVGGWEGLKYSEYDAESRRILQRMGVGVRDLDPDFWLRVVVDQVRKHDGPAVITDVRFPNEFEAVYDHVGIAVRIVRPGLDSSDLHVSETALDGFLPTLIYDNAGTIEDLHAMADQAAYFVHDVN